MRVSNIIVPSEQAPDEIVIEWRLVKVHGLVTLQARNPGGEFTGVLLIERGMLDHTFTPSEVKGLQFGDDGHIRLAAGRDREDYSA